MMKKIILLCLLISLGLTSLPAQNIQPEQTFNTAKEFFDMGKYSAARPYFEDYLKQTMPTSAGSIQEADYYLAAIAYELRESDADEGLDRFLEVHPYSPYADQVRFMLAKLMFEQGNYKQTLHYLKAIQDKNLKKQDRAERLFLSGYAYLQIKDYPKASSDFNQLRQLDTRYNLSAAYYDAYINYIQGDFDKALPDFLNLENVAQYKNTVPYYIIQIYYNKGEYDQITSRAETLLKDDPNNPNNAEIYRIVGEISYAQKNYERTISSLKKYEELSTEVLRNDMYLLGLSYYQTGDYANAIQYLSRTTTKADEMSENAYLHIGNSYVKLNDKVNARLAYEAALNTNFEPTVREMAAYNYALTTYETNAPFGESISAFERFINEFPGSKYADNAYDYLSTVYMTTQNFHAAYESIIKIKKQTNELTATKQYLLNQIGVEEFLKKNYEGAVEKFSEALVKTYNKNYEADSYFWRAESYYRLGKYYNTQNDLNKFFTLPQSRSNPNLHDAYYLAGYTNFTLKQYHEALVNFKKYEAEVLAQKDPVYADVMNRMGDCYYYERDFVNAEKSYNKAIVASAATGDYALFQIAYMNGLQKKYTTKIMNLEKLIVDFPGSQYADDALYEIGRAYLMMENADKALTSYDRLLSTYPNGNLAPKAALEIGMVHYNRRDLNKAIAAYKKVIEQYPGSEESRTALESLESAYIDSNNVASYIDYTKTLGKTVQSNVAAKEDSIAFIAVERQYMSQNYKAAITGFISYLEKYCGGGTYCTTSMYYLADSYYQTGEKDKALTEFEKLVEISGNKFMEESVLRAAEINYDNLDYNKALSYFERLQEIASTIENKNIGRLGVLRASYFLNNHQTTIDIAGEIIDDAQTSDEVKMEARYNRAKAYIALGEKKQAIPDLEKIAENTRTRNGAESKYLLAQTYYEEGDIESAENVIMDFTQKNTPYQYWLGRSFILLADIYMKKGDDFQAKQYLLSLQKNYTTKDDIQIMIINRLEDINTREQKNIIN